MSKPYQAWNSSANASCTARNALVTGTYYDLLTAAKIAGGASAPIVFFFQSLYAGGYTSAELVNSISDFRQQVDHVLTCSKSQSAAQWDELPTYAS